MSDPIERPEYEARNAVFQAQLDKLSVKMDTLNVKMDSLGTTQNNMRTDAWKYVATSAISFFLGTGTYVVSQVIITHFIGH